MRSMANKIFLDTNVVLDFLLARPGELSKIEHIINLAKEKKIICCISETVISTSMYFLANEKKPALFMLREFCSICQILPCHSDILHENIESFRDIEDGLLYFLALYHKLDFFITRNHPDFKKASRRLPVFTPTQFIKYLHDIP